MLFPFFGLWIFYCRYNIRILSSKLGLYFLEKSIFLEISFLPLFLFPSNRRRNKLNLLNSTPWISRKFLWIALPAFFLAGKSFSACVTPSVCVGNPIHIHIILLIQRNVKRERSFVKVTIIFADRGCREVIYSTCSLRKFSSFVFCAFKYLLGMLIKYTKNKYVNLKNFNIIRMYERIKIFWYVSREKKLLWSYSLLLLFLRDEQNV